MWLLTLLAPLACSALIIVCILPGIIIDKRTVVVASRIPRDRDFMKVSGRLLGQARHDVLIAFRPPLTAPACRKNQDILLHLEIHSWIAQREELVARFNTGEAGLFACFHALEEGFHGLIQPEIDLG